MHRKNVFRVCHKWCEHGGGGGAPQNLMEGGLKSKHGGSMGGA